jgi:hypothetical protein
MGAAQDFFLAIQEQRFEDVQKYVAGKMAEGGLKHSRP